MAHISKQTAEHHDYGPVEAWSHEADGYTLEFALFKVDLDSTPMLKGLPGDRCTCPHWGYVFQGRVTYTIGDEEEVHEAGDAFYVPAGHLQRADAGTEYLQISPTEELRRVSETIMKNMQRVHQEA